MLAHPVRLRFKTHYHTHFMNPTDILPRFGGLIKHKKKNPYNKELSPK